MRKSWMNLFGIVGLTLALGCGKQPVRSAAEFKGDTSGRIVGSSSENSPIFDATASDPDSDAPAFDGLTEPTGADSAEPVPKPPQFVIPGQPDPPTTSKEAIPRDSRAEETMAAESAISDGASAISGGTSAATIRRSGATREQRGFSPERVYFATNREPVHSVAAAKDPDLYFGGDCGDVVYGTCEVSIPYRRAPGSLPEPSILRLEFSQDPEKHVVLMEIALLPNADFWKQLRAAVDASPDKRLLLFIHGYSATFRDSARRTAQMAYDMNYQGPSMFFSWPAGAESESFSEKANYLKDLRRAEESDEDLITVLAGISRYSGARRIHLVAHSMGNFVLTEALKTIDDRRTRGTIQEPLFDQVALAAPDLDAKEFVERTGERLLPFSRRFTVYASEHDKALRLSRAVNGYEPLGFLNEYSRIGAKKRLFDLVDVSQLTTGWFDSGHIYYGDMPEMISEFDFVFRGVKAASLQRGLGETPPIFRLSRRN
ncbi:MAG TPA: alpha/beta hydrolase [Planctomycetaceae bacterium]|nr:alpha/beta hydrolase [Planctomycetaceae bacterium]